MKYLCKRNEKGEWKWNLHHGVNTGRDIEKEGKKERERERETQIERRA